MMHIGPRSHGAASLSIRVPTALPADLRVKCRELSMLRSAGGNGDASALMLRVCAEADDTRTHLFLHVDPEPDSAIDANGLHAWYGRNGFTAIQAEPLLMLRVPNHA